MRGKPAGDEEVTREHRPSFAEAPGQEFSSEEMQAIREQYEERVRVAEEGREELEWQVRMALARVRDAGELARRGADEMERVYATLAGLVGDAGAKAPVGAAPASKPPPIPSSPPASSSSSSSSSSSKDPRRASAPLRPGYQRLVA